MKLNAFILVGIILITGAFFAIPLQIGEEPEVVSTKPFDGATYKQLNEVVAETEKLFRTTNFSHVFYYQDTKDDPWSLSLTTPPDQPLLWKTSITGATEGSHNFTFAFWGMPLGDVNGDGQINDEDVELIQAAWYSKPTDSNWDPRCDFNEDGKVDSRDVMMFSFNYDKTVEPEFLGQVEGNFTVLASATQQPDEPKETPFPPAELAYFGLPISTIFVLFGASAIIYGFYKQKKIN